MSRRRSAGPGPICSSNSALLHLLNMATEPAIRQLISETPWNSYFKGSLILSLPLCLSSLLCCSYSALTFVEFCERFSYYGTTAVFVNFIQQPRPFGSRTGNIQENAACFAASTESACLQPGGLGLDQQAASGMTVNFTT